MIGFVNLKNGFWCQKLLWHFRMDFVNKRRESRKVRGSRPDIPGVLSCFSCHELRKKWFNKGDIASVWILDLRFDHINSLRVEETCNILSKLQRPHLTWKWTLKQEDHDDSRYEGIWLTSNPTTLSPSSWIHTRFFFYLPRFSRKEILYC